MNKSNFVEIVAGSEYGARHAYYEIVGDRLILRDEGDHDNLAGNSIACDFEGYTLEETIREADVINSEPVGHNYDGCHACKFGVHIYHLEEDEIPEWLTYSPPQEAAIIKAALAIYRKEPGCWRQFKAAVRAL